MHRYTVAGVPDPGCWSRRPEAPLKHDSLGCRLAYSAQEHGWSAGAFHGRVDTYGAALVLGRTAGALYLAATTPEAGLVGVLPDS